MKWVLMIVSEMIHETIFRETGGTRWWPKFKNQIRWWPVNPWADVWTLTESFIWQEIQGRDNRGIKKAKVWSTKVILINTQSEYRVLFLVVGGRPKARPHLQNLNSLSFPTVDGGRRWSMSEVKYTLTEEPNDNPRKWKNQSKPKV